MSCKEKERKRKLKKHYRELFEVCNEILDDNAAGGPRAAKLPKEWRIPLVKVMNEIDRATGGPS